jgi:hypothetical protein
LLGRGAARQDADKRALRGLGAGRCLDFQKHGAGGAGGDARRLTVQQDAEACGATCHCERRFGVFQDERGGAILPGRDLVADPSTQHRRGDRAAVEQHGVDRWAIGEEFGEMAGYRGVGGVRESPFAQRAGRLVWARRLVAVGEEAVQQNTLNVGAGYRRCLGGGEKAGTAAGNRDGEWLVRGAWGGQGLFFQIAAGSDELIPLGAGKLAVRAAAQASFHEMGESEVNVVAAEEDVVADGDAANVGDRVGGVQTQAE